MCIAQQYTVYVSDVHVGRVYDNYITIYILTCKEWIGFLGLREGQRGGRGREKDWWMGIKERRERGNG